MRVVPRKLLNFFAFAFGAQGVGAGLVEVFEFFAGAGLWFHRARLEREETVLDLADERVVVEPAGRGYEQVGRLKGALEEPSQLRLREGPNRGFRADDRAPQPMLFFQNFEVKTSWMR